MQVATALVYKALNADTALLTLLGGKVPDKGWNRIYNSPVAPYEDEYPRITMFEVINEDADPSDDEPQCSDINIRIDVWTRDVKMVFPVCKQIKQVLKNSFNTCTVRLEETMHEKLEKYTVYHKPINIYLLLDQGE
jgi:hypothetical protein